MDDDYKDWHDLIVEAFLIGLTIDEIRAFLTGAVKVENK